MLGPLHHVCKKNALQEHLIDKCLAKIATQGRDGTLYKRKSSATDMYGAKVRA